jgi:hypothetical protein
MNEDTLPRAVTRTVSGVLARTSPAFSADCLVGPTVRLGLTCTSRNFRTGRERTEFRREVLTYIYGDENFVLSQDSRLVTPNDILNYCTCSASPFQGTLRRSPRYQY